MRFLAWLEFKAEQFPKAAFTAFILAAAAALGPFVASHFQHLWNRPHYQFFPMMLVALAVIAVTKYGDVEPLQIEANHTKLHIPLLLLCLAALAIAHWVNSPWMGFLSTTCLILLFARNVPELSPAVFPLLILLPLPFSMDQDLIHFLQRVSSAGASALLDAVGILHLMSGNVLEVNGGKFFVEEACSGIGSVFLLLASAAIYACWKRLRIVIAVPLLVASIGWAVAANTFRIFVVAWSHVHAGPDLSHGLPHEILGGVTYLAAMLLLAMTEQFLLFLLDPIVGVRHLESPKHVVDDFAAVLAALWNRVTSMNPGLMALRIRERGVSGVPVSRPLLFVLLAAVFAAGGFRNGWNLWRSAQADSVTASTQVALPSAWANMKADLFANANLPCQLVSFSDGPVSGRNQDVPAGHNSKTWELQIAETPATVTLSGPVEKTQNLRQLYEAAGWKILQSATHQIPELEEDRLVVSELILHREDDQYLHVLVASFRKSAAVVTIPAEGTIEGIDKELTSRLMGSEFDPANSVWQMQLQIPSNRPTEPSTRPYWQRSFEELFTTALNQWRASL